jgi:hypothetical protein
MKGRERSEHTQTKKNHRHRRFGTCIKNAGGGRASSHNNPCHQ